MNIFRLKAGSLNKSNHSLNSTSEESNIFSSGKSPTTESPNSTRLYTESESSVNKPKKSDVDVASEFLMDEDSLWDEAEDEFFMPSQKKVKANAEIGLPESSNTKKTDCNNIDAGDCQGNNEEEKDEQDEEEDDAIDSASEDSFSLLEKTSVCRKIPKETNDLTCDFDLMYCDDDDDDDVVLSPDTKCNRISDSALTKFESEWKKKNECDYESDSFNKSGSLCKKDSGKIEDNSSVKGETVLADYVKEVTSLDIDDRVGAWVEEIVQNEAFSSVDPDTPHSVLKQNLSYLQNCYTELLERMVDSFQKIPINLLKVFPGFDSNVFLKLRTTKKRMKALMIRTNNLLEKAPTTPLSSEKADKRGSDKKVNQSICTFFERRNDNPVQVIDDSNDGSAILLDSDCEIMANKTPVKTSSVANSSFIDYTSAIYKTPVKTKTNDKFQSNMRNDGATKEFDGFNFPHSNAIQTNLRQKFGLRSFRPNQLQVINAALLDHDCFVLMPTGGGKSLCYQLPAIISPGVTVVISPLRSLILDQVTKMLTLDIPAAHLSGDLTDSEASLIYSKLNQRQPSIKLLYVTPEKIGNSNSLRNCFSGLYRRGMLSRFVIDEVHCVSQWGHDFRPDYKKLRELRENFPNVKIMALTATATPRVRTDILHQLKMENPKWFLSSFNRSNLVYSVRDKKGKSVVKEIAELIQKEYKKETGVIYCFSRKECEDVAKELKMFGVDAIPYHAGLNDNERTRVQTQWMNDKVKVVCATIAFGMGVDKLDVRFVIHYSIPKSIEGYYQESGRAGRDGCRASCILYYAHRDKLRMLKLINMDQTIGNQAARKVHIDNLFRVVAFAENKTDCRRALQLEYLGEKFDRRLCIENRSTACDNCLQQGIYNTIDVTEESKAIVSTVKKVCEGPRRTSNYTMLHFVDVFKGAVAKKVIAEGHDSLPLYGMGKSWLRLDIERLFRKLIMEEFLTEHLMVKDEGITFAYLKCGRRADDLLQGKLSIKFDVKKTTGKKSGVVASTTTRRAVVDPAVLEIQEKCYGVLMDVIKGIAAGLNCNPNAIMNIQAIRLMSQTLPETDEEMLSINHVTEANFEKYGAALLDVTRKFAEEKRAVVKVKEPEVIPEDKPLWPDRDDENSHYFEPHIEFAGGYGNKRKRKQNYHRWQFAKKAKGSGKGRGKAGSGGGGSSSGGSFGFGGSGRGRGGMGRTKGAARGRKNPSNDGSGVTTLPLAKFSTLMEIPARPSSSSQRLKNL